MTSPLLFFPFLLLKQTNRLSSDRSHKSQETSKCGKNISDILADWLRVFRHFFVRSTFDVVRYQLLNRSTALHHGIYLLK